jgi:hypothetical protein
VEVYIEPIRAGQIIKQEELSSIFSNWEMLSGFNSVFLKELEETVATGGGDPKVGALFKRFAPFFRM